MLHPTASTAPIQGVPGGILPPKEKIRGNVPDWSGQNSEDKTASLPLVYGPANQSRDQDSRARDNSSISIGMGGLITYGILSPNLSKKKRGKLRKSTAQNPAVHAAIHGQQCRANPIV